MILSLRKYAQAGQGIRLTNICVKFQIDSAGPKLSLKASYLNLLTAVIRILRQKNLHQMRY